MGEKGIIGAERQVHEFNEDAMGAALTEMRPLADFEMTQSHAMQCQKRVCERMPKGPNFSQVALVLSVLGSAATTCNDPSSGWLAAGSWQLKN